MYGGLSLCVSFATGCTCSWLLLSRSMSYAKIALALLLTSPLLGCDGAKSAATQANADAKAKPANTKTPPPAAGEAKAHGGGSPHGAPLGHGGGSPHGAPLGHGAPPPNANPHGGMGKAPAPPKAGPPRDVTPSGETSEAVLAEFKVQVPTEWEKGTPSSMMRMAQWVVPGPGGDAELVVFRFSGGAGGVEANMKRWKGQFHPPEGKTPDDIATQGEKTVADGKLKVSTLDVAGRYVAAMRPGAEEKHDKPDQRMLAAIVENQGDPLFFKVIGPKKTVDVWSEAWVTMIDGLVAS